MLSEVSNSPEATQAIGSRLGQSLQAGDIVLLTGPLGAGKTCLTRGLAQGLGLVPDSVLSPTFQLVRELHGGRLSLYHLDLYRLSTVQEVARLGLEQYFDADGVSVVEWPERLGPLTPKGAWEVVLEPQDNGDRLITVTRP